MDDRNATRARHGGVHLARRTGQKKIGEESRGRQQYVFNASASNTVKSTINVTGLLPRLGEKPD